MRRTLARVAGTALAALAGALVVAPPVHAAVSTAQWGNASTNLNHDSFDDGSVPLDTPATNPNLLTISTTGYGHSHGGQVTLSINLLPAGINVWSTTLTDSAQQTMNVTVAIPFPVGEVTGVHITSSPYQSWTYHGFQTSDTITLTSADAPMLPTECDDGLDNDLNGKTDYPSDPGCTSPSDTDESSPPSGTCPLVLGVPVCTSVTSDSVFLPVNVSNVTTGVAATHYVVGSVDVYSFAVPGGGRVNVPCVVLTGNNVTLNPCGQAGGTRVSTLQVLYDETVDQPSVSTSGTLFAANVCNARVTVTAAGIGVEDFPAFTLC